jgi:hypothetical protein
MGLSSGQRGLPRANLTSTTQRGEPEAGRSSATTGAGANSARRGRKRPSKWIRRLADFPRCLLASHLFHGGRAGPVSPTATWGNSTKPTMLDLPATPGPATRGTPEVLRIHDRRSRLAARRDHPGHERAHIFRCCRSSSCSIDTSCPIRLGWFAPVNAPPTPTMRQPQTSPCRSSTTLELPLGSGTAGP